MPCKMSYPAGWHICSTSAWKHLNSCCLYSDVMYVRTTGETQWLRKCMSKFQVCTQSLHNLNELENIYGCRDHRRSIYHWPWGRPVPRKQVIQPLNKWSNRSGLSLVPQLKNASTWIRRPLWAYCFEPSPKQVDEITELWFSHSCDEPGWSSGLRQPANCVHSPPSCHRENRHGRECEALALAQSYV